MLKITLLALALTLAAPMASHAKAPRPRPGDMPGGANRPAAPTPVPESAECKSAKDYALGLKTEAHNDLNSAVAAPQSASSQLEINFYNCRQRYADEAYSVAEISVCGGYLSKDNLRTKVNANFRQCDSQRAAEKLALAKGYKTLPPQPDILVTPDYKPPTAPAAGGGGGGTGGAINGGGNRNNTAVH